VCLFEGCVLINEILMFLQQCDREGSYKVTLWECWKSKDANCCCSREGNRRVFVQERELLFQHCCDDVGGRFCALGDEFMILAVSTRDSHCVVCTFFGRLIV